MHRKTQAEACERLKFLDATALKRQCTRFAADHADAIAAAEPVIPDGLANRAADVWEPLLAIADLAGGRWPDLARKAALALTTAARGRNPIASLLLDILLLFVEYEAERIFSRDLVTCLNATPGRPWDELRKGRAIDEIWLARQLRPYGIQPITIRIEELQAKGYTYEALKPVFRRYIPPADVDNYEKEIREAAAPADNPEPGTADLPPASDAPPRIPLPLLPLPAKRRAWRNREWTRMNANLLLLAKRRAGRNMSGHSFCLPAIASERRRERRRERRLVRCSMFPGSWGGPRPVGPACRAIASLRRRELLPARRSFRVSGPARRSFSATAGA